MKPDTVNIISLACPILKISYAVKENNSSLLLLIYSLPGPSENLSKHFFEIQPLCLCKEAFIGQTTTNRQGLVY